MTHETINFNDYADELERRAVFFDKDLLIIDSLKDFEVKGRIEVDAYILSLCTKGHGTLTVNDRKYDMGENDLFICRPSHILETLMRSIDYECVCVCMSKEFMHNILLQSNSSWNTRVYIENNPVIGINAADSEIVIQYLKLIKMTMAQKNKRHYKDIVTSLWKALSLNFSDILEQVVSSESQSYSTAEKIFNDFFDLLTSTTARHRPVAYYAEKLNITAKYLSVISKKVSGKAALELVTEYAIREIEAHLQMRDKTIKGIAFELGFENISYFSKYFKHYTGMSPKRFREESRHAGKTAPEA